MSRVKSHRPGFLQRAAAVAIAEVLDSILDDKTRAWNKRGSTQLTVPTKSTSSQDPADFCIRPKGQRLASNAIKTWPPTGSGLRGLEPA